MNASFKGNYGSTTFYFNMIGNKLPLISKEANRSHSTSEKRSSLSGNTAAKQRGNSIFPLTKERRRRKTVCAYTSSPGGTSSRAVLTEVPETQKQRGLTVVRNRTSCCTQNPATHLLSIHHASSSSSPRSRPKQIGERLANYHGNTCN